MGSVDVVVVGAGVAGLSAAIALQRSSRNVVVLEARSRVGGRVFTSPRGLEWGAMWLHGTRGHPLLQHNVECELVEVVPDCWWRCGFPEETCLVYNSIPVSQAEFESSWETYQRISRGIGLEITEAHKEIPADVVFFSFVKEHFPQVVEDLRLMNTIKWFLYKIEDWMGEALHELSAHDVFSGSPALWGDFPGSHAIVKGGMLKLIERILDKYDVKVFHDKPVAHIDYSGEKARVLCEDGTEYIADKVISAVPVAVLNNKSIRFSPEVPKTYQDIFSRYGQSNCLKIFLEFKSCFWSSFDSQWDKTFWGFIGDQSRWGEYWIWVNLTRVLDRPVLNIDVVGEMQEELESRSSEQIREELMGILRASFGPIVDEQFESMESFSWNKDRFSQGAYCFNPMGSSLDDVETTKIPLNDKLYFAGDFACGEFLGSVHGASLCGEMHANHILKSPRSSGSKE